MAWPRRALAMISSAVRCRVKGRGLSFHWSARSSTARASSRAGTRSTRRPSGDTNCRRGQVGSAGGQRLLDRHAEQARHLVGISRGSGTMPPTKCDPEGPGCSWPAPAAATQASASRSCRQSRPHSRPHSQPGAKRVAVPDAPSTTSSSPPETAGTSTTSSARRRRHAPRSSPRS